MADNPADQETMRSSARFFAEAIDIHREYHSSQDAVAYNQLHEDLEIDLSEGAAKLQERFNWLEKDLRLYADADEISADDKEGLLRYTQRVIETAVELSAMRSEYAALGVFLKKGPKEGALEADQILNKGDLFAKLKIPENLREWFGENILAPTLAKEFSARKDVGQETLKQVNSNIRTIERWNLAEGEAHLSRYAAQVKFYQDKKNADAVKEAEDRYKKLSRKLEDETRDLFKDQVINGVRRHGELKILYKLADNPAIGRQPVAEAAESAPPVPEIDLQSKPALVERQEVPKPAAVPKPADSVTSTPAPDLTKGISAAPVSTDTTGTGTQTVEPKADAPVTADPKTGTTATVDPKAGYETVMNILHAKGRLLDPDYSAMTAEATLKKFVEFYLPLKSDDRIAPDDLDNLDSLIIAATLYHRAGGDFEKMISPELFEDVLFTDPPARATASVPVPPSTGTGGSGAGTLTSAGKAESETEADETDADEPDNKPKVTVATVEDLEALAKMAEELNYDGFAQQASSEAREGKLSAMRILELLDEELNQEKNYDHKLAKDNLREYVKSHKADPNRDVSLGDQAVIRDLARLALSYRLVKGDSKKIDALHMSGSDAEKATIDGAVSRFVSALGKYHKEEKPKADASSTGNDPVSTKSPGADSAVTPPQTQDDLLNPDNLNWGYLLGGTAAATAAALAIRKVVRSRSAAQPAAPAQPATPAAGAAANNTTNTPAGANGQTGQPTGANTAGNNGQTVPPTGAAAGTNGQTGAQPAGTNPPAPQNQPASQATQQAPANNPPTAKDIQKIDEKIKKHEATIKSQNEKLFQLKEAYDRLKPSSTEGIAVKDSIEKLEEEIKKTHGKLYRREQELKTIRQNSGGAHNPVTTPHAGGSPVSPVVTPTPGPTVTPTPPPGPTVTPVNPAVSPTPLGPPAPLAPGAQPTFIGPPAPQPGPGTPPPVPPTVQTVLNTPPANPNVSVWGSLKSSFNKYVVKNLGGINVALGADGLADSIKRDDAVGMGVNSTAILTGSAAVLQNIVTNPKALAVTKFGASKNPLMAGVMGLYEIGSQEGDFIVTNPNGTSSFGDKTLRALEISTTVAVGVAAGTAAVTAGVVGLPAIVIGGTLAYGATKVAGVATDFYRSHRDTEQQNQLNQQAAQVKITMGDNAARHQSGTPAISRYDNLNNFAIDYTKKTNVRDHVGHVERTDYSVQKNMQALEKALSKKIEELEKTIKKNDSTVPGWMKIWGSETATKKADAEKQLAPLLAARKELEFYKQDLAGYKKMQEQKTGLFTGWFRADEQLEEAAKGGFHKEIIGAFSRDGDQKLSVAEIKSALVNGGIKSREEIDTDHDDIISHDELEEALCRGLDGVKDLVKGQFSEASTPEGNTPVGVGGGPTIKPGK